MCGIIGCIGDKRAAPLLLDGLRKLQYRGYDSAGFVTSFRGEFRVKKGAGRIEEVMAPGDVDGLVGWVGCAHIRWASHGAVNQANAHPFVSCDDRVAVVHNGIVANYRRLKESLQASGHKFTSKTDSEVIVHLVEDFYRQTADPLESVRQASRVLVGDSAFVAVFSDVSVVAGSKVGAPLILGLAANEKFVASDVLGFLKWTDRAAYLADGDSFAMTRDSVRIVDRDGNVVVREPVQVPWQFDDTSLGAYEHYTLKEIEEQASVVEAVQSQPFAPFNAAASLIERAGSVVLTGAGSSFNAALFTKYLLGDSCKLDSDAVVASELKFIKPNLNYKDVLVAFSQSGETADVLEAVEYARQREAKIVSFVNVPGSSLVRQSDVVIPLVCGPEIGVAATKSFTAQLTAARMLARGLSLLRQDEGLLQTMKEALKIDVNSAVNVIRGKTDVFLIGKSLGYPIALEGALKMKELALIHAEGLLASELKHGTLAMVKEDTPVIAVNPTGPGYEAVRINVAEAKARGAKVIGISDKADESYDVHLELPRGTAMAMVIASAVPIQRIAYELALYRQVDPDHPRNLAKSVTVQ
jgi:glucosamine--fructose-6-phosphate aminotransferase (isomerizing)